MAEGAISSSHQWNARSPMLFYPFSVSLGALSLGSLAAYLALKQHMHAMK